MLENWTESIHFPFPGPVHVCYTELTHYLLNAQKKCQQTSQPAYLLNTWSLNQWATFSEHICYLGCTEFPDIKGRLTRL